LAVNFTENDWPPDRAPEVLIFDSLEKTTECVTLSLLTHRTMAPVGTVMVEGVNTISLMLTVLSLTDVVVDVDTTGAVVAVAEVCVPVPESRPVPCVWVHPTAPITHRNARTRRYTDLMPG
jgi:hypothetical protein